jgi:hypothetical protein
MGYHMRGNGKSKLLAKKLLTLDIDEGIRIESPVQGKKIFVNKNKSNLFVVQLVTENKSSFYNNNNVRYFDSAEEVIELVNLHFQNRFTIVEY